MSTAIGVSLPRLATAVGKAVSEYAVLGKTPGFTADFIKNKYPSYSSFASAITHSRSGNATMTDGYGPELVVNGGFDSDTSGWVSVRSAVIGVLSGRITVGNGGTSYPSAAQSLVGDVFEGTTYVVTMNVTAPSQTNRARVFIGDSNANTAYSTIYYVNIGQTQTLEFSFTATAAMEAGAYIHVGIDGSAAGPAYFDNVSVREMPVLKWAPHNLVTYSEDLSNAVWGKTATTVTANAAIAPDGTLTANKISHTATSAQVSRQTSGTRDVNSTVALFAKYVDHQWLRVYHAHTGTSGSTWFDLQNGIVGTDGSGTARITDVGNGWYLCEMDVLATSSNVYTTLLLADYDGSTAETVGTSAYIWGVHLYRSDLGGMAGNPDQPPSRASYVPTTSTELYLPRVGHHVYNGSAWVNEGLLAESEARTNLIERSNTFNSVWSATGLASRTANEVGPDGVANSAYTLTADTSSGIHVNGNTTLFTSGSAHTGSCYFKKGTQRYVKLRAGNLTTWPADITFDLDNGVVDTEAQGTGTIQEVGNGWYRCSATATAGATANTNLNIFLLNDSKAESFAGTGAETVIVWGAQAEVGSTPSSFIPSDDGSSAVTRAAETFTIPSANLPWPSPEYIGSELVTNGTFDTDVSGWSDDSSAGGSVVWNSSGYLNLEATTGTSRTSQSVTVTAGNVYAISIEVVSLGGSTSSAFYLDGAATPSFNFIVTGVGTHTIYYVAPDSSLDISIRNFTTGTTVSVDNVSVREINPLSVSIAIDGRVTYADEGVTNTATVYDWTEDADNRIYARFRTDSAKTGQYQALQEESGTTTGRASDADYLTPGIFVPFNAAARHGSTFINLALDGEDVGESTAPIALADLSSTDLDLAFDYMGTIGTFRIWDRDITDEGIEEATNPSLEPSLSLTFEGTGTNSFVVNDWSE